MKITKILTIILLMNINSLFAQDSNTLQDQIVNKKLQERISDEINRLDNIDTSIELSKFIEVEEEKCMKRAEGKAELIELCFENSERMEEIGDVETIIDLDIIKLTEFQTSVIFTALTLYAVETDTELWILFLPVAIILDIPTTLIFLITGGI